MKKIYLLILLAVFSIKISFAQRGKNGAEIVNTLNTVVNEYSPLTVDADSGNTMITVSDNTLNTNARFSGSLSAGDLVMIVQMQGAILNASKDSTWGTITSYGNCGWYELDQVAGISGNTIINLQCPLKHNYTAAGNVQVIRVPRYTTLTVNSNDTLTCDTWNGATGGVLTVEVSGNTVINTGGAINATRKGFRGGVLVNTSTSAQVTFNFVTASSDSGAQKGESIAGFQSGYTLYGGMFGRGAPANGGGGADTWNSGGGGGANAGNATAWTGNGTPDTTTDTVFREAWNLEYYGFANSTSSGGGRGGYSFSGNDEDALTVGPGDVSWGSDFRENNGGKGGRPLDYSTGRIFLGGGGGSGQEDNNNGGGGGIGGGIIYLLSYGTIGGDGIILSNGQNGGDANSGTGFGDGSGGAGGGGTVILNSSGVISGISIYANGGTGGSQFINQAFEAEGPGGGGGGGYISISNGSVISQTLGGGNGITTSPALTEFPPNGATEGGSGSIDTSANFCIPQVNGISGSSTVCSGSSITYVVSAVTCGAAAFTWTLPTGWSGTSSTDSITVVAGSTGGTISVAISNGSCPMDTSIVVTVNPAPPLDIEPQSPVLCDGEFITLSVADSGTGFTWSPATGLNDTIGSSVLASPTATITYTVTGTDSAGCPATGTDVVSVVAAPNKPTITVSVTGDSLISSATQGNQWYFNDALINGATNQVLVITGQKPGSYIVIVINPANGCSATSDSLVTSGVNQLSVNSNQLSIYPNPSTGTVTIASTKTIAEVKITNVLGQIVYQSQPEQNKFTFDLKDEGMYFVTVTVGKETTPCKIVVSR